MCIQKQVHGLFPFGQFFWRKWFKKLFPNLEFAPKSSRFPVSLNIRDRHKTHDWFRPSRYHDLFTLACLLDELGEIRFCLMNSYDFHVS